MKRFLIIAAVLSILVACEDKKKSVKDHVKDQMVEYSTKMLEATQNCDEGKMYKTNKEFEEWFSGLSQSEKEEALKVGEEWQKENEAKIQEAKDKFNQKKLAGKTQTPEE